MTNARDKANIPVLNFQSKGIDDNADATAITIDSSERVGIGTASPATTLHIAGGIPKFRIQDTDVTSQAFDIRGAGADIHFDLDPNNAVANGDLKFDIDGSNKMMIRSSGKVEINTSGKTSYLNVNSAHNSGVSAFKTLRLGDTGIRQHWTLDNDNGTVAYFSTNGNSLIQNANSNLMFYTNGTERMRVNSTGLGVGTSAPSVKLDVRATSFTPYNTNTSLIVEAPAVFSQAQHFYIHNAGSYNSSRPTGGIGAVNASSLISLSAGSICTGNPGADGFKATATTSSLYDIGSGEHAFKTKSGLTVGDQFTHQTRMIIKDSGSVGIGTVSPDAQLHIVGSDTTDQVIIENTDTGTGSAPDLVLFRNSSSPADNDILGRIDFRGDNDNGQSVDYFFAYATATDVSDGTEDAKLQFEAKKAGSNANLLTLSEAEAVFNEDSNDVDFRVESNNISNMFVVDGNSDKIFINTSSSISGSSAYLQIKNTYTRTAISTESNTAVGHHSITFHNPNGQVGDITTSGSATQYNTSSDYRLKENVVEITDATSRLKQLKPKRFNFITDADTTVDGFIAHEVSSIVPEAITGTKDAVETYTDDDGNEQTKPKYQGIDQSKLVPLLVKTIQELEARITTLEANNP